jgi:Domain of unknown function (DUF4112)
MPHSNEVADGFSQHYTNWTTLCHVRIFCVVVVVVVRLPLVMQFKIPRAADPVPPEYARLLDDVDKLADNLDRRFQIPLTRVRFGWDPVIGLVPVAGDIVTAALAIRIIMTARRLGADRALLRRMAGNSIIDVAISIVPIVGTVVDVFYRSNVRNVELLKSEIRRQRAQ